MARWCTNRRERLPGPPDRDVRVRDAIAGAGARVVAWLGSDGTRRGVRRGAVLRLTTAMSGVVVVGAIIAAGRTETRFGGALGFLAVALATVHVVGALLLARRERP